MKQSDEYFSPEHVAQQLGLNVRTVRRYIREGQLKATRIGKQYRIAAADFREFIGSEGNLDAQPVVSRSRRVVVSATTDIRAISPEQSHRITALLTGAFGTAAGRSGTHLHCLYLEDEGSLRVVVSGELEFTSAVLALINAVLLDEAQDEVLE